MNGSSAVLVLIAGETSDPLLEMTAAFDFLSSLFEPSDDPVVQIDQAVLARKLAGAVAAAEVAIAVKIEQTQRAQQIADNWKPSQVGKGIGEQIGLARRTSPSGGALHLSFARSLVNRFPHAYEQLRFGRVGEQACKTLVSKTSHLSDEQAALLDAELAPLMPGWNLAQTETAVCSAAYKIDPHGWVERRRHAERERRVWIRPAPDTMSIISALLPAAQGVAVFASLTKAANTAVGIGDERGLGQVMADTLVERVTGQTSAPEVPAEVLLTVTPETLFGDGDEPGWLKHYGAVPAELARAIASGNSAAQAHHERGTTAPVVDSWYPLAGTRAPSSESTEEGRDYPQGPGLDTARQDSSAPRGGGNRRNRRKRRGNTGSNRPLSLGSSHRSSNASTSGCVHGPDETNSASDPRCSQVSAEQTGGQRCPEPGAWGDPPGGSCHYQHGTDCASTGLDPLELARADVWIRRVLTDPITGVAIDVDQRRRRFEGVVRRFITIRDRECRGPFCSAPIRENDHIIPWAEGGPTTADNGQGVCQRNNQLKELKGWTVTKTKKTGEVLTRTPTGHTYRTSPPPQIGYPTGTIADPSPREAHDAA